MQTVTDWKVKNREYHKIVNTSTALETVPKAHRKKNQNKTKHFLFFCFLTGFDPEKKKKKRKSCKVHKLINTVYLYNGKK